MLSDLLMWNKIGRIVTRLSERLNIDTTTALGLFYKSETCKQLHDADTGLYLQSDLFIVNNLIHELQD